MAVAAINMAPSTTEKRNFQRVRIKIYGRYMLEDRSEYPCHVIDMSAGDVAFRADQPGELGEKVIVYLEHLGRLEGVVTRQLPDGFAMTILASDRKRDKLAAKLTWLANRDELGLPEDRRHERMVPRNPMSILQISDNEQYQCRILDLSLSGAAMETVARPEIGSMVTLGNRNGRVVRHFDEGIAIEFSVVEHQDVLAAEIDEPQLQ